MAKNFRQQIMGFHQEMPIEHRDTVKAVMACYPVNNAGQKNNDGSYGKIRLTSMELEDLVASMLALGYDVRVNEEKVGEEMKEEV